VKIVSFQALISVAAQVAIQLSALDGRPGVLAISAGDPFMRYPVAGSSISLIA
jgi:hypothetical protein